MTRICGDINAKLSLWLPTGPPETRGPVGHVGSRWTERNGTTRQDPLCSRLFPPLLIYLMKPSVPDRGILTIIHIRMEYEKLMILPLQANRESMWS